MRKILAVLLLAALPLAAQAQNETVTVAAESLIGPWKIGFPLWSRLKSNMSVDYGPMRDAFCRMEGKRDDLHAYCLLPRTPLKTSAGDMSLHGDAFHIFWGDFFGGMVIDATQKSPGVFTGSIAAKVIGIPVIRAPGESIASKIAVSDTTPDAGGKSAVLAKLLAGIAGGAPLSSLAQLPAKFPANAEPPTAGELRGLGAIQLVAYLGHTATPEEYAAAGVILPTAGPQDRAAVMEVYDVEFANGERVCELHQQPDGAVDEFVCA